MKKIVLVLFLSLCSSYLFSQETIDNQKYVLNNFWDNWFLNFGGGSGVYFGGKQHKEANFIERLNWATTLSVGKWFSPLIGARLTFQGGKKHTFNVNGKPVYDINTGEPIDLNTLDPSKIHHMTRGYYITVHADAMFNFSNLLYGYKDKRFYNLITYAGAGMGTDRNLIDNNSPVIVLGLLNTFRINEKLTFSFDISGQTVQSKFNDAQYQRKWVKSYKKQDWNCIGSVNLGLIIGLSNKQKFDKISCDTVNTIKPEYTINEALLSSLSKQLDSLTKENRNLIQELENQRNLQSKTVYIKDLIVKNNSYSIQFDINSSSIDPKQETLIFDIADFLKKNEDFSIEIVGLADKNTGSSKFNEALSIKRAKAIENKLIRDYGISPDRIFSSGKGDTIQPYPKNYYNRVVILTLINSK
ncbi:MAG: OmpA family protein [Apibacter sp.]|jgi:OmpA-OmpF porin, OOP family|nr:OmpA family protein [Apibacter sp.]